MKLVKCTGKPLAASLFVRVSNLIVLGASGIGNDLFVFFLPSFLFFDRLNVGGGDISDAFLEVDFSP